MLRLGCCDVKSIHGKKFSENSIFDGPKTLSDFIGIGMMHSLRDEWETAKPSQRFSVNHISRGGGRTREIPKCPCLLMDITRI